MKPQDLACFDLVAKVIGKDRAIKELQKVVGCECANIHQEATRIDNAFHWSATPQGVDFWYSVDELAVKL